MTPSQQMGAFMLVILGIAAVFFVASRKGFWSLFGILTAFTLAVSFAAVGMGLAFGKVVL